MTTFTLAMSPRELSHEMRVSLAGILTTAALLEHDNNLNHEQHEKLCLIQQAGVRLLVIVNQILDAACKSEKEKNAMPISSNENEVGEYQPQVLLVEDEPIVQRVHKSILEKLGCKVDLAVNAEQALEKAKDDYDLIFMDVGLPGKKSGIDVTKEIRTNKIGKKDIPIVVLTGYTDESIKNECLAAQANAVYTKPINMNALHKILEEYITVKAEC